MARHFRRGDPARSRGFSLIEVLAAFVILAIVATTLFQLFSGALANVGASADWSRAVLVAESRLAAAANTVPLVATTDEGSDDDGRIRWQSRVTPWDPPDVDPDVAKASDAMVTRLFRIEVAVRFPGLAGGERTFSLATVRVAGKALQ
jgi:general secretion pathway protein I